MNIAIIDGNKVFNIIKAESIEVAEELFPGLNCVEFLDEQENKPIIGLKYEDGIFEQLPKEPVIEYDTFEGYTEYPDDFVHYPDGPPTT